VTLPGALGAPGAAALLAGNGHAGTFVLVAAVFFACAVEMVEALTIVLAVGVTRGWKWSLWGAVTAVVVLAAVVAAVGPALVHYVPIDVLRVVIGVLLLVVGVQWLRKAVLRASGRKAKHDEDAIYAETVSELERAERPIGPDWVAFGVSFKGVLLEGIEVVIIVLTLGIASHDLGVASLSAAAAFVLVGVVGVLVARQLSEVPENTLKMAVGLMLVSFGTFWIGEGLGLHWPGSDLWLPVLVVLYGLLAWVCVSVLSRHAAPATSE